MFGSGEAIDTDGKKKKMITMDGHFVIVAIIAIMATWIRDTKGRNKETRKKRKKGAYIRRLKQRGQ